LAASGELSCGTIRSASPSTNTLRAAIAGVVAARCTMKRTVGTNSASSPPGGP
jgi:hypothetical protein